MSLQFNIDDISFSISTIWCKISVKLLIKQILETVKCTYVKVTYYVIIDTNK